MKVEFVSCFLLNGPYTSYKIECYLITKGENVTKHYTDFFLDVA